MPQIVQLLKSRFLRSAGAISGGAAIAQALTFLTSPLLTRLYGPEPFGLLAIFLAFVTFAAAAASLHYEMAIALPREDRQGAAMAMLAVFLAMVTGITSFFIFSPGFLNLIGRMGYTELVPYWWLLPFTIFGTGLQQALTLWYLRRHRFVEVAQNGIIQSISQNGLQAVLGGLGFQSIGLLLGLTFSRFVAGVTLLTRKLREDKTLFLAGYRELRETAAEYKSFPSIGLFGAILHIACFQIPPFLLADLYGAKVAGWYIVQERVLIAPLTILAQGVASVFYVSAARLAHENSTELRSSYFRILRNLSLAGSVPTLVLLAFGPVLFKIVFGAEWETAGEYARILAVPTFLRFVAGPLFRCLTILKRQSWIFICDGLGLLVLLASAKYISSAGWDARWLIIAIAVSISLAYGGLLLAATLAVLRHRPPAAAAPIPASAPPQTVSVVK